MAYSIKMKLSIILSIPILLIHGYGEDAHVFDSWLKWLKIDHITNVKAITFLNDDKCGTVAQHATELANQIHTTVNIVAHSQGGLVARWYIAHSQDKVANLIMIGTPNHGTEAAYVDLSSCAGSAGVLDLQPHSDATQSVDKTNQTHYYTIAGNYATPCFFIAGFMYTCYLIPNDGLVTVSSAQSSYLSLGVYHYNHDDIMTHKEIYETVLSTTIH